MSDFLNINIIDIGFLRRNSIKISTKNKPCYVLGFRVSGSSIFHTSKKSFQVNSGDIVFIPKGKSYSQETDGEDIIFVHLEIFGNTEKDIQCTTPENPKYIHSLFMKLYSAWEQKGKNHKYKCTSLLYEIIAETSVVISKANKDLLYPAIQYINEHFSNANFSLDKACEQSHISRVYFNRLFKEKMLTTPSAYINKLKIEKAQFLLLCGAYTHSEIANLCGFSDTKYFYTIFKKITGTTVGKFQRNK